ncbi:MAG: hypothetical protein ACRYG8_53645 [Janthinobacterium lividum]
MLVKIWCSSCPRVVKLSGYGDTSRRSPPFSVYGATISTSETNADLANQPEARREVRRGLRLIDMFVKTIKRKAGTENTSTGKGTVRMEMQRGITGAPMHSEGVYRECDGNL